MTVFVTNAVIEHVNSGVNGLAERTFVGSIFSGNVEAGFVYKTDAAISRNVKIAYAVPIDEGPKIIYPLAIIRESKHKDAARDFVKYLQSQPAKDAFKKFGFVVLN